MSAAPKLAASPEPSACVEDTAAKHLGIRRETLYRWIEKRKLPACRLGRHWKFKLSEVDAGVRAGGAEKDARDARG
jgi:excisionase family DNA binding protein